MRFGRRVVPPLATAEIDAGAIPCAPVLEEQQLAQDSQENDSSFTKFDSYEFVANNEAQLQRSTDQWQDVATTVRELKDPELPRSIHEAFLEVSKVTKRGKTIDYVLLNTTAEEIARQMPTYILLSSRYQASLSNTSGLETAKSWRNGVFNFSDPALGFSTEFEVFPKSKLGSIHDRLSSGMGAAERTGDEIVGSLVDAAQSPDDFPALAELYEAGIGRQDQAFAELGEVIRADWLKPQSDQSILRKYVASLDVQSDVFIGEFADTILDPGNNQIKKTVLNMARFAIIAKGKGEVTEEGIRDELIETYPRWDEVEVIGEAFSIFVDEKTRIVEQAINSIVGTSTQKTLRISPKRNEVIAAEKQMKVIQSRPHDRKRSKRMKNHSKDGGLVDSIASRLVSPVETVVQPKELTVIKNTPKGCTQQAIKSEELFDHFEKPDDEQSQEDILTIIERLRHQPIGPASERVKKNGGTITVDGKPYKLWKFSPNKATALGIHPDNRYLRCVYVIKNGDLLLVDILSHDDFDKKY